MTSLLPVLLRPFEREEVELYRQWMSSPEIVGSYVELEHESSQSLLVEFGQDGWQSNRLRRWLIIGQDSHDEQVMGFAHCWECDRYESHIELGLILLPQYRGRGLGTSVLSLIVTKVFSETRANRLQCITSCDNKAMLRCLEKAEFVIEGRLREYMTLAGRPVDCYLASILRPGGDGLKSR